MLCLCVLGESLQVFIWDINCIVQPERVLKYLLTLSLVHISELTVTFKHFLIFIPQILNPRMSRLPTLANNAVIYEGNPEHFASSDQTRTFYRRGQSLA